MNTGHPGSGQEVGQRLDQDRVQLPEVGLRRPEQLAAGGPVRAPAPSRTGSTGRSSSSSRWCTVGSGSGRRRTVVVSSRCTKTSSSSFVPTWNATGARGPTPTGIGTAVRASSWRLGGSIEVTQPQRVDAALQHLGSLGEELAPVPSSFPARCSQVERAELGEGLPQIASGGGEHRPATGRLGQQVGECPGPDVVGHQRCLGRSSGRPRSSSRLVSSVCAATGRRRNAVEQGVVGDGPCGVGQLVDGTTQVSLGVVGAPRCR